MAKKDILSLQKTFAPRNAEKALNDMLLIDHNFFVIIYFLE